MFVMEVIVRLQDRALCASITCISGTYAKPEGRVIFDHRHNADEPMVPRQLDLSSIVGKVMLKSASSASNPSGVHVRRSVLPGRGAHAMAASFRRWTGCATAGTMARCAGAIAHEPGGGPDERSD